MEVSILDLVPKFLWVYEGLGEKVGPDAHVVLALREGLQVKVATIHCHVLGVGYEDDTILQKIVCEKIYGACSVFFQSI